MMEVIVEYDYQAQNPDELTIKKGDRIRNVTRKEEGWYEGELVTNGRHGVFPDNFVKPVKPNLMKNIGFNSSLTKSLDDSLSSTSSNPNPASMSLSSTLKKKNVLNNNTSNILNTASSNGTTMNGATNLNGSLKSSLVNMQPITSPPPPPPPSSAVVSSNGLQNGNTNTGGGNNKSLTNGSLNSTSPPPPPPPPVTKPNESFTAKVLYSYVPANDDECPIQENDIVQVLRLVEDGWYEGIHNGKRGVFPSNYVEKIVESAANSNNLSNESLNNSSLIENVDEDKKKNKKVLGIGFGNIFSGKQIELKTKENFNKPNGSTRQIQPMPQPQLHLSPQHQQQQVYNQEQQMQMQPTPPGKLMQKQPPDLINTNNSKKIKARVLYDYEPTQPDELKLVTGELIYILDKNLEDEGWWKGESLSTGEVGVFPDNFVEQINEPQLTMNNHLNKGHMMLNAVNKRKTPTAPYPVANNANNVMANSNSNGSVKNVNNDMNLLASSSSSSSSASSTSSSNNSLSKQPNTLINNKQQHMQQISSSLEDQNNNSKSQSDISEDLEDIRENDRNKLTHIKKSTRQFNKRPPSFRSKNHKQVEDDEDTNSFKQSNSFEKQFNGTHSPMQLKSPLSSMQPLQANMQPGHQLYTQQTQQQATFHHPTHSDVIREQTPPSPVLAAQSPLRSNSILGHSSSASHMQQINLIDELGALKLELDQVKKNSAKSQSDYKQVENELNELKKAHDEQMKKMQKRLQDLISEIDEEKKTRLALQVELERLKKTIMNN